MKCSNKSIRVTITRSEVQANLVTFTHGKGFFIAEKFSHIERLPNSEWSPHG